ncbi:carbohydrate ABC transporter permease [Neobacillus niacini]|uniref:carbohydrate ABC transporter permease n=1 Tax=Neobacillus niacini TaxID=86668 RepID=UPI00203EC875|nr:sugar ABC transporter permease [Neobacillus niacini]MCM3693428.1 sugar ABC transporter permease [Neobacillus niacini]
MKAAAEVNSMNLLDINTVKRKEKSKQKLVILSFMFMALFVYTLFILYPIISTFIYSFYDWNGIETNRAFVGFANYSELFSDPTFWQSLTNNFYLVGVSVFVQIPLGLMMALVLNSNIKGQKLLNVIFFLPYLMSTVAVGLLWVFMFDPTNGPINKTLNSFGIESVTWLAGSPSALIAILIVMAWQFAPFYMILFKAALVGIPEELYEAAGMDGANDIQKFFYVTLPSLIPILISSSVLAIVGSLKTFDLFYVMSGSGAGTSTAILGTFMYEETFVNFRMGYGSTIAAMMFIIALICVVIIQVIDSIQKRKRGLS